MDIGEVLLKQHGIRVQKNMSEHVLAQLTERQPIKVIGGDARTGVAIAREIDPATLSALIQAP